MNGEELRDQAFEVEINRAYKERADKRSYLLMRLQKSGFSTAQAHALLELVETMTDD
jgi:hypothetical protein